MKLVVDYDRVRSLKTDLFKLEELLGKLLRLMAVVALIFLIIVDVSRGGVSLQGLLQLQPDYWSFLLSLAVFVYLYSGYLLRDKNRYQSNAEQLTLDELRRKGDYRDKQGELQVDDYFAVELTTVLSDVLDVDTAKPFQQFGLKVLQADSVKPLAARLGLTPEKLEAAALQFSQRPTQLTGEASLSECLVRAFQLGFDNGYQYVDLEAVLLVILQHHLNEYLSSEGIDSSTIAAALSWRRMQREKSMLIEKLNRNALLNPISEVNASRTSVYAPTVEQYCDDLTQRISQMGSKKGRAGITLSLRREALLGLETILASEEGLALVTGPAGAGKTTLIDTLVARIIAGQSPESLQGRRVLELNVSRLLGEVEPQQLALTIQKLLQEQARSGNMIIVIDDFDQILSLGEGQRQEIATVMAAELSKVEVKLIATVTTGNYEKYLRQLPELEKAFAVLELPPASRALTEQVLFDELPGLEKSAGVVVSLKAIRKLVELSEGTDLMRVLPDKAIDNLRDCLAQVKSAGLKFVEAPQVEEFFSRKTGAPIGIPENPREREKLVNLAAELNEKVIGQQDAVRAVASALQRARAGLVEADKPQASFMFFGPTGVGKTHLAKTIAEIYYGNPKLFLRLDMSEYQEEENLDRLLGKRDKNGYREGVLTGFVLTNPYSLVLLDELEKANPRVLDLFLQILDNASILDGMGRQIDFSGVILVATSNAGSNVISNLISQGKTYKEIRPDAYEQVKSSFRTEFLNRFNAVVMFAPLGKVHAESIARLLLWEKKQALLEKGIEFVFGDELVREVVDSGYDQEYGARSLKREIAKQVDDKIARLMIAGKLKSGDVFRL